MMFVLCTECHEATGNIHLRLCTPCLTRANAYANNRIKADKVSPLYDKHGDRDLVGRKLRAGT